MQARRDGKRFLNAVPTRLGGISIMLKVLPEFFFGGAKRVPTEPLGPFVTDMGIYAASPVSGLRITWFGHSSSLVEIDGTRVLLDPIWEQRASPAQWLGPKRFFPPTVELEDLPPIDVVVISHDHFDHLGAGTVARLARSQKDARWITTLGVGGILSGMGVRADRITELDWTQSSTVGSITLTALPARHFSGRSFFNRFQTLWASFALVGPMHRVYYGADSGEWDGFGEIGRMFGPFDLTMLEIGAFHPAWADIHMGPHGAVRSFRALGSRGLLMPIHWGLFDLALHHWRQPIETVFGVDSLKLWSPTPGVPSEVVPGQEIRSEWWR